MTVQKLERDIRALPRLSRFPTVDLSHAHTSRRVECRGVACRSMLVVLLATSLGSNAGAWYSSSIIYSLTLARTPINGDQLLCGLNTIMITSCSCYKISVHLFSA